MQCTAAAAGGDCPAAQRARPLPPPSLSSPQVDLRYMWELGRCVPVIPVITKADTMTIREAQNYKQEVGGGGGVCRLGRAWG